MISIENLCFRYPNTETNVLNDISLTIDEGDYIAIVGTSGSGKSTFLSILGLLNKPSTGDYLIAGKNILNLTNKSLSLLKTHEIGFIFQNYNLLSHLSIFHNVALPLNYNSEVKRAEYRGKVIDALEKVNMSEYIDRKPDQLSGGQQQRIAIARALVNNPSLILADEPTGNLDTKNSQKVYDLLAKLNKAGNTICLITHEIHYASKAKKLWHIEDGRLLNQHQTLSINQEQIIPDNPQQILSIDNQLTAKHFVA